MVAKPADFEFLGDVDCEGAGQVYCVKLKQRLDWKDLTLNEGPGIGKFSKGDLFKIDSTPATQTLAERFIE